MTCTSTPTLESILHNRSTDHYREFAAFVHETFCTENLSFWLAIQHYLDLCHRLGYGTLESLDDAIVLSKNNALFRFTVHERGIIDNKAFAEIQGACHAILYNHIRPNSPQEINIPCEMRQEILQLVQEQGNYHPAVFAAATESVVELMRANSFIPWTQRNQRTSFSSVRSNDDQLVSLPKDETLFVWWLFHIHFGTPLSLRSKYTSLFRRFVTMVPMAQIATTMNLYSIS